MNSANSISFKKMQAVETVSVNRPKNVFGRLISQQK